MSHTELSNIAKFRLWHLQQAFQTLLFTLDQHQLTCLPSSGYLISQSSRK